MDQRQMYAQVVVKENERRVQGVKAKGLVHIKVLVCIHYYCCHILIFNIN